MIVELGHLALILAFAAALVQMVVPMIGAHKNRPDWMEVALPAANVQFVLTLFAFGVLMYAFIVSDFSVQLVALNSHSDKPMLYKVTGTWGNHEGSLLLWVLILTLFGAMVAWWGSNLPSRLKARVLAVQASIAVAFFAFMLFTSNPFIRLPNPPLDGNDLNPLLQDPGLAFHPPFLYLGYVGLSMAFSFAVAALIEGRVDAAWARWVRPWTLAAWMFLTIGIALGSWWAYYELGWGGWWFWDPVENASFMPWLFSAALLHSAIVVEKRETLKAWTVLLAILAFSFSLLGTFIVRSGVLTSVHAFATDPTRGVWILLILVFFVGGALILYALRAGAMEAKGVFSVVSRESGLVLNNLFLSVSAIVVLFGTMWPLVAELFWDAKISVGAPFFNMAFTPFMIALAMILPIGAVLPWKRGRLGAAARPMWGALLLSVALGALVWALGTGGRIWGPLGVVLAFWVIFGALADLGLRIKAFKAPVNESVRRLRNLPRADMGKVVAHIGFGLTIFGISMITAFETEDIRVVKPGTTWELSGYTFTFNGAENLRGPNYVAERGDVTVTVDGREIARLFPEKRIYTVQRMPTTEAAIDMGLTRDLYVSLGDPQETEGWAMRTYVKPYANWIWIGSIVMALGGVLSLTDRRYRVGAAQRKMPVGVPAE